MAARRFSRSAAFLPEEKLAGRAVNAEAFLDQIRSKAFCGDGDEANGRVIGLDIGETDPAKD